ncbi:hypothetical protein TeGR_g10375 [Tetraparma gracilis]|uniref:Uncharacterized protein n=1 Tax=Tetraparma gracilis TaxID=2962635 RepID=A0ABQ6MU71_9STRA|nr:hypothetical protein TeGR_g10375 [Tetraparma gracilis]
MTSKIPQALGGVNSIQKAFERDEEVDEADRSAVEGAIKAQLRSLLRRKPDSPAGLPADSELMTRVFDAFDALKSVDSDELEQSDRRVQLKMYAVDNRNDVVQTWGDEDSGSVGTLTSRRNSSVGRGRSSNRRRVYGELTVGSASAVVDASLERCAAWTFVEAARLRIKDGDGSHRTRCDIQPSGRQGQVVDAAYKPPGGKEMTCKTRSVWNVVSEKKVVVAFEHTEDAGCSVRCTALLTCTLRDEVGEIQLTDVSLQLAIRAKSSAKIGRGPLEKFMELRLARIAELRVRFDRSLDVDTFKRRELVKMINRHTGQYSEEEEEIMSEGRASFMAFDALKSKDVNMRSPQSKAKVAYKKGDSRAWGWSAATVRASPEEVLAYAWDTKSRYKMRPDDVVKEIDETPSGHNQLVYVKKQMPTVIADRDFEFFQQQRTMGDYDKADGRALGYRLTYPDEKNKKTPSKAVARIVKLHKGLSQLSQEYPWIVAFLEEILKGGLHRNKAVSTKLDCLSEREARRIGMNLPWALRARKTAEGGVYQWEKQNPSMVELFKKLPWVEEMIVTMGEELLKNAAWGMWFRVISGSGLSMVDLATDINVIRVYFEEGQNGYGWMMLGMVLASMGLQLLVVVVQNGKMGWGKLLREVLITVSGLKPGVDAMRVVSNAEMDEHHMMDAKMELVVNKCCEMVCESVPGCILQVYALIQGASGDKMRTKVLSIAVSALTTGMSSASISYDFDSDPEMRRLLPSFYGFLPDEAKARTIMYLCLVVNSSLLLLLRSIGAALLMHVDKKIFAAYVAGDHLLYLLQKLYRSTYWSMETGNECIQSYFLQGESDEIKKYM